jgi:short-subunit dehydrogenase
LSETDGRLDALVNNAGVAVAAPMEFVPLEELRDQLEVNVVGLVAVTQAFLPAIRKSQGRVVNIGSISGILTTPLMGPYCASKHAVEAVSDAMRQELRPHGVKVALIQPGRIITPIWQKSMQRAETNEEKLPDEGRKLYGKLIEAVKKSVRHVEKDALPVEPVAEAVWHALTNPEPKTRYLVAKNSLFIKLIANLPDKLRDGLIRKQFGG